jgi:hypothetical protein
MGVTRRKSNPDRSLTMKKWLCASFGLVAVLAVAGNAHAAVPEMDASGAVTAISLLAGLVALAAERLRRK